MLAVVAAARAVLLPLAKTARGDGGQEAVVDLHSYFDQLDAVSTMKIMARMFGESTARQPQRQVRPAT